MSKGSKRNKGRNRPAGTSTASSAPSPASTGSFTASSMSTRTSSGMGGSSSSADFSPPIPPDVAAQFFSQMAAIAKAKKQQQQQQGSPSKPQPFGPSRPPGGGGSSTTTTSVSFGSLDLAALAQSGDFSAAAAAAAAAAASGGGSTSGSSNGGPPCSEAEVKALMGMFAEIMGMSMEATEGASSSKATSSTSRMSTSSSGGGKSSSSGPVFMFGQGKTTTTTSSLASGTWSQGAMAAAARAASLYSEAGSAASSWGIDYYEDDFDDDDDDDDDYEDDSYGGKGSSRPAAAIREEDWESLEQVAAEDESEAAERARKAAKKREKKQRKKERLRREAAEKAALAAQKKRDKALQGWRSRIVQACQANDSTKVEALIGESPLKKPDKNHGNSGGTTVETDEDHEAFVGTQVEFLLRSCIAKTPDQVEEPYEARHVLTTFAIHVSLPALFVNTKAGRNSLHSASMVGDYRFCQWVVEGIKRDGATTSCPPPENWINLTCQDSGWSALHYAVMSGSKHVMEVLLAAGANVKIRTDEVSTSNISNGQGVTPRELAECVLMGKHQDALEYSGSAMDELLSDALSNGSQRRRYHGTLRQMIQRLTSIEHDGYSPSHDYPMSFENGVKEIPGTDETETTRSTVQEATSKKKRRKKKKNQQQQSAANPAPEPALQPCPTPQPAEDPMITALLGMGFTRDQIDAAVKACGGTSRATADDLVMWIFEQQAGGPIEESTLPQEPEQDTVDEEALAAERERQRQAELARKEEEAKRAAERLAAKKEEQRRRNREWNNREQARQREEQQAKLKKAVELRARADAYHAAMAARNRSVKYSQAVGPGFGAGPPPGAVPHTVQKQQAVPKTILQPPRNTGLVGGVPGMNGVKHSPSSAKKGKAGNSNSKANNGAPDIMPHKNGLKNTSESPHIPKDSPSTQSEPLPDATESLDLAQEDGNASVASSVRSGPPGFMQPQGLPGPPGLQDSASTSSHTAPTLTGYQPDMNATGEMRATARAFVPSNFTPPPSQHTTPALKPTVPLGYGPPESTLVSSTPSFDTVPAATSSLSITQPQAQQTPPNDSLLEPLSSMLSGSVPAPLNSGHVALFERTNAVTPSTTHSATSSVTGVSANTTNEEPVLPPGMGFGLDASKGLNVNPLLFDSTSLSVPSASQSSFAGSGTSSVVPGASLWGSGGMSLGQPAPVAGLNLGGGLGVDDRQSSVLNSSWSAANQPNGSNNSDDGGATMPNLGSIW